MPNVRADEGAGTGDALPPPDAVLAKARGENFPVAMRLVPKRHRRHLMALYGFARMVDDLGDEAPGDRVRMLDEVSQQLDGIFAAPRRGAEGRADRADTAQPHAVYAELAATVADCGLTREPFERLVEANRQDQVVHRYRTFDDLLGYCALSADPVGRLVLGVFGSDTPWRRVLSDRVCSALQLLEHCQDVVEDARAGRIYLPLDDLDRFGVRSDDLLAPRASRAVRALVAFEVQRAVQLLDEGAPLVGTLRGAARVAVAGYVAGGRATAVALADARFDVLAATPRPTRMRVVVEWLSLLASGGTR